MDTVFDSLSSDRTNVKSEADAQALLNDLLKTFETQINQAVGADLLANLFAVSDVQETVLALDETRKLFVQAKQGL